MKSLFDIIYNRVGHKYDPYEAPQVGDVIRHKTWQSGTTYYVITAVDHRTVYVDYFENGSFKFRSGYGKTGWDEFEVIEVRNEISV